MDEALVSIKVGPLAFAYSVCRPYDLIRYACIHINSDVALGFILWFVIGMEFLINLK